MEYAQEYYVDCCVIAPLDSQLVPLLGIQRGVKVVSKCMVSWSRLEVFLIMFYDSRRGLYYSLFRYLS